MAAPKVGYGFYSAGEEAPRRLYISLFGLVTETPPQEGWGVIRWGGVRIDRRGLIFESLLFSLCYNWRIDVLGQTEATCVRSNLRSSGVRGPAFLLFLRWMLDAFVETILKRP